MHEVHQRKTEDPFTTLALNSTNICDGENLGLYGVKFEIRKNKRLTGDLFYCRSWENQKSLRDGHRDPHFPPVVSLNGLQAHPSSNDIPQVRFGVSKVLKWPPRRTRGVPGSCNSLEPLLSTVETNRRPIELLSPVRNHGLFRPVKQCPHSDLQKSRYHL